MNDAMVSQMTQIIVDVAKPEKVILFGSYARGDATTTSDIDFMVVEAEPFGSQRSRRAELLRLWLALTPFMIAKDILLYSTEEVEQWKGSVNHVIAQALREGSLLYERP
ncbi:MAG: nucleotidyltransferase domain-containing protein [Mariprofundaceae bacterium]|nr:nucleotidyltransferase domain-containing protein [Mariprofundaceae bacterium]